MATSDVEERIVDLFGSPWRWRRYVPLKRWYSMRTFMVL